MSFVAIVGMPFGVTDAFFRMGCLMGLCHTFVGLTISLEDSAREMEGSHPPTDALPKKNMWLT